jgi:hypothetical protein
MPCAVQLAVKFECLHFNQTICNATFFRSCASRPETGPVPYLLTDD